MTLTRSGFAEGAPIPPGYSCDGHDISPPLAWSAVPPGTSAFALIMEDPHATSGTFVHWVLYDLPPYSQLPPGIAPDAKIGVQGVNSAGKPGYTGPCPPRGSTHHYRFRIFALDAPTGLPAGATAADVRLAIQGHTLATATLTATFGH